MQLVVSTKLLIAVLGALLLTIGCGGGGGAAGTSGGSSEAGTLLEVGALSTRVAGAAQPPVTLSSAAGASVTGVAGALVSNITLNPQGPPTLADTRIAFSSDKYGNRDIFSVLPDGSGLARLTTAAGDQAGPSWASNGTRIAYCSNQDGSDEIYVMNSNGTSQTRLTNMAGTEDNPAFSPDGSKIAFASTLGGYRSIYVMNANGTGVTRLTFGSQYCYYPTWSPDGARIAYYVLGTDVELWSINNDGTHPVNLTAGDAVGFAPAWSPDGTRILYVDSATHRLAIMSPDGTGAYNLGGSIANDSDPTWAPDSYRLAFAGDRSGDHDIYVRDLSGAEFKNITPWPSTSEYGPAWSQYQPRGAKVLLGSGGTLGGTAAGFLFSQNGYTVNSVLIFDTLTTASRVDSRVVAQDNAGGAASNLFFSITTSEGLGGLRYVDLGPTGLPGTPKVLTVPAGATGALVAFHSTSGLVTSVIFYTANRSGISKSSSAGRLIFQGEFLGGWTRTGKSPQGSFQAAEFDRASGDLISIR